MIESWKIFERRNRGILLDASVFLFQLVLLRVLAKLSVSFFRQAEGDDVFAKTAVGLFLVGLFFLQPLGPILKRRAFHRHYENFEQKEGGLADLLIGIYRIVYVVLLIAIFGLACMYITDAFPDALSENGWKLLFAAGMLMAVVNGAVVFRYFRKPKKPPRWKFLASPRAEPLGDLCMFLNIICFQIFLSVYVSTPQFLRELPKATPGERLYLFCVLAFVLYLPPRIFYLVIDQHRLRTWLMILLANVPLILGVVFYPPRPAPKTPEEPDFNVTAEELHREYWSDYKAGARKYKGKHVNITGRVQTKFSYDRGALEVGLDGENGYPWAYCDFDEEDAEAVMYFDADQPVEFQCVGSDIWGSGPTFKHCVLVSSH